MSGLIITPETVRHIAVDLQSDMLANVAEAARQQNFPAPVRIFTDRIAPQVETTCLIKGRSFGLYEGSLTSSGDERAALIRERHQIEAPFAQPYEDIISKTGGNGFANRLLANYLKEKHIDTNVITGLYMPGCVLDTAKGSCANGFRTIILTDLLADPPGMSSNRHQRERDIEYYTQTWSAEERALLIVTTSTKFLQALESRSTAPATGNRGLSAVQAPVITLK